MTLLCHSIILLSQYSLIELIYKEKNQQIQNTTLGVHTFLCKIPKNICIFVLQWSTKHQCNTWYSHLHVFSGTNQGCNKVQTIRCYFPVVTPTTTLLTSLPFSSTVIGFSTTTVTFWGRDVGAEVGGGALYEDPLGGALYEDPLDVGIGDGVGATVFIPVFVI